MDEQTEIVREALAALADFRVTDRATADVLLTMWRRRGELSADERQAVLSHWGDLGGRCGESVPQNGYDDTPKAGA